MQFIILTYLRTQNKQRQKWCLFGSHVSRASVDWLIKTSQKAAWFMLININMFIGFFPKSDFTSISNSNKQRELSDNRCCDRGSLDHIFKFSNMDQSLDCTVYPVQYVKGMFMQENSLWLPQQTYSIFIHFLNTFYIISGSMICLILGYSYDRVSVGNGEILANQKSW